MNARALAAAVLVLALAAAVAWQYGGDGEDVVEVVARSPRAEPDGPRASPTPTTDAVAGPADAPLADAAARPPVPLLAGPRRLAALGGRPFAVALPPAPPATPPPAPPPPAPPPAIPFQLLGRLVEAGAMTAIVGHGERVLTMRRGDRIAGFEVDDVGAAGVRLRHLATGVVQVLSFGGAALHPSTNPNATPPASAEPDRESHG